MASTRWRSVCCRFDGVGAILAAPIVATSNTAVQTIVADRIRGRVMTTRIMTFTGAYPVGALIQTALADVVGPRPVVTTAGALLTLAGLMVVFRPGLVARLDDPPTRLHGPLHRPSPETPLQFVV